MDQPRNSQSRAGPRAASWKLHFKASGQPGASQGTADSQRLATEAQGNRQAQRARQTAPEACAQIDADGFALILGRWGHWAR